MKDLYSTHFASADDLQGRLAGTGYIASTPIATTLFLSFHLQKPMLVEGPAGVGKTELAKAMATMLEVPLIRLQCYEGLDEAKALYEWKYGKQLLYTQLLKDKLADVLGDAKGLAEAVDRLHGHDDLFFSEHFLEPRPLYLALRQPRGCVLLIDEIDKSDPEFEAFLLEVLSDFQVSVPELGTLAAEVRPLVVLTSNASRELSDALKRRCLHLYIPFPDAALERAILAERVPGLGEQLQRELVAFVQGVRTMDLRKTPSVSETLDWARTLLLLNAEHLSPALVRSTLNVILKFQQDIERVGEDLGKLLAESARAAG